MIIFSKKSSLVACALLLMSSSACYSSNNNRGRIASNTNEWYLRGKTLGKALCGLASVTSDDAKLHIHFFAPLLLDAPSSESAQRAFKAVQNIARGIKDELIASSPSNESSSKWLGMLDHTLSIIIAAPNYAFAYKGLGALISQWAQTPEAAMILTQLGRVLKSYETIVKQTIPATEEDASHAYARAKDLGLNTSIILVDALKCKSTDKRLFPLDPVMYVTVKQLLDKMEKQGDLRDIASMVDAFQKGFDTVNWKDLQLKRGEIRFWSRQGKAAEHLLTFLTEMINLFCKGTVAILKEGTGTAHLQKFGESLTNYGQEVSKIS